MGAAAPYSGGGGIFAKQITARNVRTAPAQASYQRSHAIMSPAQQFAESQLMERLRSPVVGLGQGLKDSLGSQFQSEREARLGTELGNTSALLEGEMGPLYAQLAAAAQSRAGTDTAINRRDIELKDYYEKQRQNELRNAELAGFFGQTSSRDLQNRGIDSGEIQQINALGQNMAQFNTGLRSNEMTGNADRDLSAQGQNANNSLQAAGMNQQNAQFGATFGEGQRQFDAGFGLDQDRLGLSREEMDWRRQMEMLDLAGRYPDMNMGGGGRFGGGLRPPRTTRRFAKGGVAEGEVAMVGEEGPELAFLPKDTMIVPHMESKMMMANGMPCPMPGQGEMDMGEMGEEMPGYACGGKVKGYARGGMVGMGGQSLMDLLPQIQAQERRKQRMAQSPNQGMIPMADFGPPPQRAAGPPTGTGPGAGRNLLSRNVNPIGITASSPETAAMRAFNIQQNPNAPAAAYGGMGLMGGPELADMNRRYVMQARGGAGGMEHEIGRMGKNAYDLDSFEGREGYGQAQDDVRAYFDDQDYARRRAEMGDERFLQKPIKKRARGGPIGSNKDYYGNPLRPDPGVNEYGRLLPLPEPVGPQQPTDIFSIQDGFTAGPVSDPDPTITQGVLDQYQGGNVPSGGGSFDFKGTPGLDAVMLPAPPSAEGLKRDRLMGPDATYQELSEEMARRQAGGDMIPPGIARNYAGKKARFETDTEMQKAQDQHSYMAERGNREPTPGDIMRAIDSGDPYLESLGKAWAQDLMQRRGLPLPADDGVDVKPKTPNAFGRFARSIFGGEDDESLNPPMGGQGMAKPQGSRRHGNAKVNGQRIPGWFEADGSFTPD